MGLHWDEFETGGIKCPYCGEIYDDDLPSCDGEWECPYCEKRFDIEVEETVTYYSTKLESELAHQESMLEYWRTPKPEHLEHAEKIRSDYERRITKIKERIEKQAAANKG